MLLKLIGYVFVGISALLGLFLILNKIYFCNIKDNIKKSEYVANIAILFALYVLSAIAVSIVIPNLYNKFVMILFAASPFIIGKLATYEKEKLYTTIQIICAIASTVFVVSFL